MTVAGDWLPSEVQLVEQLGVSRTVVREAMEGEAAAFASSRATPEDIRRMRAALEAIDADVRAGGDGVDADHAFHQSVVDSTGNPVLA